MKNTLINLGLTAGAIFVLYKLFKKDDVIPMNKPLPQDGTSGFDGSPEEIVANKKKATEAKLKNKRPVLVPTGKNGFGKKQKGLKKEGLNFTASDLSFRGAGDF
jgi:hypothetical protein